MKTKKHYAYDGSIFAILAIGLDEKTTFYPVTTIPGRKGKKIMVAVLEVLETVPSRSEKCRKQLDNLYVVTPLGNIYPELKAKLASIE